MAAQGHQVHRYALSENSKTIALAQIVERRLFGPLRTTLLMRGPVWLSGKPTIDQERAFLLAIRRDLPGSVMFWTPDDFDACSKRHGFRRVVTGYSTIWLDLAQPLEVLRTSLDGKWRNMLRRAEANRIDIQQYRGGSQVDWLISANENYRKKVGYRGPSPGFISTLNRLSKRSREQITLIASDGEELVAGIMVQQHGAAATYYVGCTSERGRQLRAHHLLLWRAIEVLQRLGVASFDLGGIETDSAPGLARFKLGLGGEPSTFAGTYLLPPVFS